MVRRSSTKSGGQVATVDMGVHIRVDSIWLLSAGVNGIQFRLTKIHTRLDTSAEFQRASVTLAIMVATIRMAVSNALVDNIQLPAPLLAIHCAQLRISRAKTVGWPPGRSGTAGVIAPVVTVATTARQQIRVRLVLVGIFVATQESL